MTFKENTITMHTQDDFTLYHKDLLDGHYDCVDRIVLNGRRQDYGPRGLLLCPQVSSDFKTV